MKKDKKKGVSKKTWVVDCRTDSAFDFALKVLREAENKKYSKELKINFAKIAYLNSCEAIARAQTDPRHYKLSSAFKLFLRNLKCIYETSSSLINGSMIRNGLSSDNEILRENVIDNPFDYIDINYNQIEEAIVKSKNKESDYDESLDFSFHKYSYPKIYENVVMSNDNGISAEIKPTNDIVVYLPEWLMRLFKTNDVTGEYSIYGNRYLIDAFLSLITSEEYRDGEWVEISDIKIPKPVLVSVPSDSFTNITGLLDTAAEFPNKVDSISITAYRLGKESSIIDSLIKASNNKIKCKLYLELSARGEIEQDMIYLKKILEEADLEYLDMKVRYNGIKVHGKMIYIKLKNSVDIGIFSTGNYNESTAKIYKDYHYISCEKNVTSMIKHNFKVLWNSEQPVLSSISNILAKEIYEEIAKGKDGRIWIQTNHLDNKLIVSLLKEAMRRGCDVRLIVRTTKGFHNRECKNCKTVVGKYLEHSRVYIFGSDTNRRIYLSSSDILFRNLYNRFESYVKISNNDICSKLISDFKDLYKNGQK